MANENIPDDGGFLDLQAPDIEEPTGVPVIDDGGFLDTLPEPTIPTTAPPDDGGFLEADIEYQGLLSTGDNPEADEPEAGFWSGLIGSAVDTFNSSIGVPAELIHESLHDFAKEEFPGTPFAQWAKEELAAQRGRMLKRSEFTQALPKTRTLAKLAEADSLGEFYDVFMESPEKWNTFKEFVGTVLPSSAAFAGGAALQGLKGAFGTSMILDWGNSYQESMAQGKSKEEALQDATIKALTQAGIDTATLSVAKIKLAQNKYLDAMGQLTVQAAGGGFAEWAKHELVDEKTTFGKIALEAGGELIGAPIDIYAIRAHDARIKKQQAMVEELRKKIETAEIDITIDEVQDIIDQLDLRAEEEAKDTTEAPDTGIDLKKGETQEMKLMGNLGQGSHIDAEGMMALEIESRVKTADGKGEQHISEINWDETPAVGAVDTQLNNEVMSIRAEIAKRQAELVDSGHPNPEQDPLLEAMQVALQDKEAMLKLSNAKIDAATKMVNEWVRALAPDMKVIVSTGSIGKIIAAKYVDTVEKANGYGLYKTEKEYQSALKKAYDYDVNYGPGTRGHFYRSDSGISFVEINPNNLDGSAIVEGMSVADMAEVVAHEFGHALIREVYLKSDQKARRALRQGYRKWLHKLVGAKTGTEFWEIHGPAARASRRAGESEMFTSPDSYWYNFDEYLANQLGKSVGSHKLIGTPVQGFFAKAKKLLKMLFELNKNAMPEQSFTDFINHLAAKTTMAELNAAKAANDVATQEQVIARAKTTINNIMESSILFPRGPKTGRGKPVYGPEDFNGDLDTFNRVVEYGATLIQVSKMNQHIPGLQKYTDLIKEWWNTKMQQTAMADERLTQWNKLKKKDAHNLGLFMQDLTVLSYEKGKRFGADSPEFKKLVQKHRMSPKMLALADLIDQDFAAVLNELQTVQIDNARKTIADGAELQAEINSIEENFRELRQRNFFPLSRFGEWYMRVKANEALVYDGVEYKAGDTITFETFESQKDMHKRQKAFGNQKRFSVEGNILNDTQKQFGGFPPQLLQMLRKTFKLTKEQQAFMSPEAIKLAEEQSLALDQLIKDLSPGKSFTKHMMHRKNTKGFTTDAVRSYANYFLHFGNYVARIKYKHVLREAINEVDYSSEIIGKRTGDGSKRRRIKQYMERHYENAMDPGNEWANMRAVGFLWYLGFVPKSAVVNLTQVPLVTYPFLAARYTDASAVAALTKASKDAAKYWMRPDRMSKGQLDMIHELIQTGILDESMATELAAASEGSVLNRITPGSFLGSEKAARNIRRMAGAGAWMFQKAEKMNRRVTALAAYDLKQKHQRGLWKEAGVTVTQAMEQQLHNEAVLEARDAVESTQYEYARWNRPAFMRGKASIMFLFWQYMQNSLYFLMKDPGRVRYAMMMLLFAGMSGFPFAEDAMDLYDYVMKKLNKRFGEDFADINIRKEAREYIKQLGMNPDLIMHGASRYSFGLPALGDAVGVPVPNVDMSGSLSMGSIIPGWGDILSDRKFDKNLGRAAEDLGGAVVAMPVQLMRAISDDNPDTLKRFEKAMPSFARNMSKAYRYATRNKETLPDGTVIAEFNQDDSLFWAEVGLMAAGFPPSRVAEAKIPHYMAKEVLNYYMLRRQALVRNLDFAKQSGDSKQYQQLFQEVKKYNIEVRKIGLGSMGLRPKSIRRGLKDREIRRQLHQRGIVGGKMGAQVSKEVYDTTLPDEEVP